MEQLLGGAEGRRRAPSLYGVTAMHSLMWDGRASDLEHQLAMPLEGEEMGVDWPHALEGLSRDPTIAAQAQGEVGRDMVLTALASYVRSLDHRLSRFDRFYRYGVAEALTDQEQRGFRIFRRKARCSSCHLVDSETAMFTDGAFHVTGAGLQSSSQPDKGRAEVTSAREDIGAFKTPSLRGVALRPFLLHNGSMRSLREVIGYYNTINRAAIPGIDARLEPLGLSASEVDDLIAFMTSLTPEQDAQE